LEPLISWLDQTYAGNTLRTYLVVALVLGLGFLLSRLAIFALTRWIPRLTARTSSTLDDRIVARSARPIALLMCLGAAHVCLQILDMSERAHRFTSNVLAIVVALALAVLLLRVIDAIFEEWATPWAVRQTPPVNLQVVQVARIGVKLLAIMYIVITVMQRAGFDVWSIITGLGIGGLAVALAAQETLGNMLGSLQIMTDRPFTVGDWIRVDSHYGKVLEIGLRSTTMQTGAGVRIIIPNKKIAEAAIENHSHAFGLIRDFHLEVTYGTDAERLERGVAVLRAILAEQQEIHPEVTVQFVAFADSSLRLRCIYYVPDDAKFGAVMHTVNLAIRTRFAAEGLDFAFPTRTLHIAAGAPLVFAGVPPQAALVAPRQT